MTAEAALPVSVVIVSHARPESLALTLKAFDYQRHDSFEVIVVSDQRPNLEGLTLRPRWISYAKQNISAARNIGIRAARGEIVAFCDDDAVPEFGWLQALVRPFAEAEVGAAGGFVRGRNGVDFQSRCVAVDRLGVDRHQEVPPDGAVFGPSGLVIKTVGTNCAFRHRALLDVGGFDEAYRFFLDEADLNMRLTAAGWSTASVPAAEVHHGTAAGHLRSSRRVPRSLHEIGASLRYFLGRYAEPDTIPERLEAFRLEQKTRLLRHHLSALIDPQGIRALMASLETGFEDGASRGRRLPDLTGPRGRFEATPRAASGTQRLYSCSAFFPGHHARLATNAAKKGDEVTLLMIEPSHRPLVVRFGQDGVFRHRIGLAGKYERSGKRQILTPGEALAREQARINQQRSPD